MSQPLLTEPPEKTKQRIERRAPRAESTRLFQGGSNPILQLQSTLGNRRVAQLIQAKRLTPEGKIICLQPKLTVGAADDQYEQEADRVARQVVSMPDSVALASIQQSSPVEGEPGQAHTVQSKPLPLAASITPFVQREMEQGAEKEEDNDREEDKDELLQAKFLNKSGALSFQRQATSDEEETEPGESLNGSFEAGDDVESRLNQSKGSGSPLPDAVRSYMEPRFGVDFSHVRVHTGSDAIKMNRDVGAQAFTHGSDVYFGAGSSPTNFELTAHELTHVVQQTGAMPLQAKRKAKSSPQHPALPIQKICKACEEEGKSLRRKPIRTLPHRGKAISLQRYSWDEFTEDVTSVGETAVEGVEAAGEAVVSGAETVGEVAVSGVETVVEGAEAVGEAIVSGAEAVGKGAEAAGGAVVSGVESVVEAGGEAVDWPATEAGQLATSLARGFAGAVSLTSEGLVVTIPGVCPLDATQFSFDLESMEREFMLPIAALPLGPLATITGEVGLVGRMQPVAQFQVGPFCLNGARVLINPFTNNFSISGSVSATVAGSLGAEIRGGLRGALSLVGIVPIGGIPVPIEVPLAGLEGGLAGLMRGTAASTLTIGGGLSLSGGVISMNESRQLDLGLASDLFLGAYAQLDIEGKNVCRLYWQPLEWQGEIAGSLGISLGLTMVPGTLPSFTPAVSPPTFTQIPFDQLPLALSREGFSDACPIKDEICQILETLNLLPSQNKGTWADLYPHGPGVPLGGPFPDPVYLKDLSIPSGAECRGACGPDCVTCAPTSTYRYTDPITGDTWEYTNFQDCDTNEGCREHDAAFDWAAAEHGEIGDWDIIMPWHMAANIECGCNYLGGNCIAWIAGFPPYDGHMYFADTATFIPFGGGNNNSTNCHTDYPNAPECLASYPDRDSVLALWGLQSGIADFRDCHIVENWTTASLLGCDGAPGNIWTCLGTDLSTSQDVIVSITECICCNDDHTGSSEWQQPQIVVHGNMSEELILDLCERGLIPRAICIPIEEDMIARFGNRRRNLDLNPDEDPEANPRPDDAPILDSFRRIYNRLDSWNISIRTNHPDLYPEFESNFRLEESRQRWLTDLKVRTKQYKEEFRNLQNSDPEQARRSYETFVLGEIQEEIEQRNRAIAVWYQDKTGSTESIEDLIERVHGEGTELWRTAWRRAILQVNRVLARLWPPAKTQILIWVGQQQARWPDMDLLGTVGELDYIGSLATGYKGPPKQQIRFNPDKFDVDANLEAPPLAKYALARDQVKPDRQRIFGRKTSISPLNSFSDRAHSELSAQVDGYDTSDPTEPFDVAIEAAELPVQRRERLATERLFELRNALDNTTYTRMLNEINAGGYLTADGSAVRTDLTDMQFDEINAIMNRYTP